MTYVARPVEIPPPREDVWGTLRVEILGDDGEVVGAYGRNYPTFYDTFCPFTRGGRDLALYSPDYTATRVLELPSCRDLGGEEPDARGFCPVDYFVPVDPETGEAGDLGFVAGCFWGDDVSWKIQALDLSGAAAGSIVRDERFGPIELPAGLRLSEAIELVPAAFGEGPWVVANAVVRFEAASGRPVRSYDM